jgi:hypothetical protein
MLAIDSEDDVYLRPAPGLTWLEPHVERYGRNAVDDVLSCFVFQIVDSDAHAALPASVTTTARRRRDLFKEPSDV